MPQEPSAPAATEAVLAQSLDALAVPLASPTQEAPVTEGTAVTAGDAGGDGGGAASLSPSPSEVALLVGGLGILLRPGELEHIVAALSNMGFDTVEALGQPMAAEMMTITAEILEQQLQERGMGARAIWLTVQILSQLADRFGWPSTGN